ncbi:hypothetical protein EG68_03708 [Paragonimus skrjabini miyazakii]|uniref:Protein-tyrosine sulfotransferase n=1 Tax=Paragonimus skrjabini miyazakii TaxID=59628 RepID=A0A8S9Z6R9_9TREM|nr:hypothetical protein EG68_03708 [Paragonimus skrjabini miyazakii]
MCVSIFPKLKFITVIITDFRRHLSLGPEFALMRIWNGMVRRIFLACQQIGPRRCMTVRYELLVLDPERMMRHVFDFLGLPWNPRVLEHEKWIWKTSNLSRFDKSTVQVLQKIHTNSLFTWFRESSYPHSGYLYRSDQIRNPMLHSLGYTDLGLPPDYRKLSWEQPQIE